MHNNKKPPMHIVVINYFSTIFIISGMILSLSLSNKAWSSLLYFTAWLYIIPPLLCRLTIILFGRPEGIVSIKSRAHFIWSLLFQYQLIFNRFPSLEEVLKLIPGVYALWLNLWGARVSMFVFWSSGVTVIDRYNLCIDKGAIIGTECLLSGHFLTVDKNGNDSVIIGKIHIESGALIGTRAMVAPGCIIRSNETLPATRLLMPFTEIKDGKKHKLKS
jgi:acetyltransferase-like isoleucine patch superfamily enzyme